MNALHQLISQHRLNESEVMNRLQGETAIISDNCVEAADVAEADCAKACRWVKLHMLEEAMMI